MVNVEITACHQLQPAKKAELPQSTTLSNLEATFYYARVPFVWLFDKPLVETTNISKDLQQSLTLLLDKYPHYAGKLSLDKKVTLRWGTEQDPGLEYIEAACALPLDDLLPPEIPVESRDWPFVWDRADNNCNELCFSKPVDLSYNVRVQTTLFKCGGFAIAIVWNHALADGGSLVRFMRCWSEIHEAIYNPAPENVPFQIPTTGMLFDTMLLDQKLAAEVVQDNASDADMLRLARSLPTVNADMAIMESVGRSNVKGLNEEPQVMASIMLHFPADQINLIQKDASDEIGGHVGWEASILGYIWCLINRARDLHDDSEAVDLFLPMDIRPRLGLPTELMGSPILTVRARSTGRDSCKTPATLASTIKNTLGEFDSKAVLAAVYDAASHDPKFGQVSMGRHSLIYTSMSRLSIYDLTFSGGKARLGSASFVGRGGWILLTEAESRETASKETRGVQFDTASIPQHGVNVFFEIPEGVKGRLCDEVVSESKKRRARYVLTRL
ncbi:transferase family [Fusarium phyllophilum]|uniref:Transferase family n=1 Tax=Fusarium phyllophilum TaxID=47803 RepID=A0A8H5IE24_9HYPO|nr:transferase family [Fusarium phyllophilum]